MDNVYLCGMIIGFQQKSFFRPFVNYYSEIWPDLKMSQLLEAQPCRWNTDLINQVFHPIDVYLNPYP